MSAEFVLTETDQAVCVSYAGRKDDNTPAVMLECFNLDNALSLRAALEMGMEVRTAEDSSLARDTRGVLTLTRFDELQAEGRVVMGRFCATVELGDMVRLAADATPDGMDA